MTRRCLGGPASVRAALLAAGCTAMLAAGCAARQGVETTDGPAGTTAVTATGTPAHVPATMPTIGGSESAPQGPPGLIAFRPLGTAASGASAAEVTTEDQLDRFLTTEPEVADLRGAVRAHQGPGTRLFAFGLLGCQNTGARLVIDSTRVSAELTGGGDIQCFVAERFIAVFAVALGDVPAGATVG